MSASNPAPPLRPVAIEDRMVVSRSGEVDARRFAEAALNLDEWGRVIASALGESEVTAVAMKDSVKVVAMERPSVLSSTGAHKPCKGVIGAASASLAEALNSVHS